MYSVILMTALAASPTIPDCHGHGGCYGCHGCYGCYGCWGGCYGCYGGCYGCWGGCYGRGCYGCYGYAAAPVYAKPAYAAAQPAKTATVVVDLPADAKMYVFDKALPGSSARRAFKTPALEAGYQYYYEIRVEVVRDGKTYSETKRLGVRVGETAQVEFTETDLVTAENEVDRAVVSAR
jgi:uncharacterized protein (TIGR03000 family)